MDDTKNAPPQDWKKITWEWVESLIVAFIIAFGIIRPFFVQPFSIPSGSMRMTLVEGDRLFVNKLRYGPLVPFTKYRLPGFGEPRRGDVIVFRYPVTRDKDFIKRLIAFGGETVEIRNGRIYVDDKPLTEGAIGKIRYYAMGTYANQEKVQVPPGHFFVLGDNSSSSHDSRFWGFVPEELLIGKAECLFWPLNRIGWIK